MPSFSHMDPPAVKGCPGQPVTGSSPDIQVCRATRARCAIPNRRLDPQYLPRLGPYRLDSAAEADAASVGAVDSVDSAVVADSAGSVAEVDSMADSAEEAATSVAAEAIWVAAATANAAARCGPQFHRNRT